MAGLVMAVFYRGGNSSLAVTKPSVRIYAPSSFISQWGPGPWLKEKFEQSCNCEVEFLDSADINLLLQRLKMEGSSLGADLVIGFDQFDLEKAQSSFEWKGLETGDLDVEAELRAMVKRGPFVAYDWGILTFVVRRSEMKQLPKSLEDLLGEHFKGKIALEDPRTSTPGLQFLLWLIQVKGEEETFQFLKKFDSQVLSYSPNWSGAYGLFQKGKASSAFSYVTSPVYHLVEEKTNDVIAIEMKEQHPIQIEYMGQPINCRNCDLGLQFAKLMVSAAGQKVLMEKNYMFPILKTVRRDTPFQAVPNFKILDSFVIPPIAERERILKRWTESRRIQ